MKIRKKHIITFSCFGLAVAAIPFLSQLFPAGEIYLTHSDNQNFHIVEITAKDLAKPFFGTSFHLTFDPTKYEYDHFSLGSYFENSDPLVQVAQNKGKVVVGISLKRGSLIKNSKGNLIKLFFKRKNSQTDINGFSFQSALYSTFENGRLDVPNIKFTPQTITN